MMNPNVVLLAVPPWSRGAAHELFTTTPVRRNL